MRMRNRRMGYRVCENCAQEYLPTYPTQRWCGQDCKYEYRNAELRAARKMWQRSGKPKALLNECREEVGSGSRAA